MVSRRLSISVVVCFLAILAFATVCIPVLSIWRQLSYGAHIDRNDARPAIIDAKSLLGSRWPVEIKSDENFIDTDKGQWLIIVINEDCDECQEFLFMHGEALRECDIPLLLIRARPFQWDCYTGFIFKRSEPSAQILFDHAMFVAGPAVYVLEGGTVVQAGDGDAADTLIKSLFDRR